MFHLPCPQRLSNPNEIFLNLNSTVAPFHYASTEEISELRSNLEAKSKRTDEYILYPNPTVDGKAKVYFKERKSKSASVKIYTMLGNCIFSNNISTDSELNIDLSGNKQGVYLIKIEEENSSKFLKLIYQ